MPEELAIIMEPGTEDSIAPLLQQLKQGSEPAFNALYRMHSRMLLSNIRKLVRDNEVAKELLQDLYMKVWEKRESIDLDKPFKSFLYTIAKNMVYNYLHRVSLDKKARVRLVQDAVEYYSHAEEDLEFKETDELVKRAIGELPSQARQVFTLSKMQGKSHQQIAEELGISIKTVNNHMVKANKEVRAYLLSHGDKAVLFLIAFALHNLK